MAKQLNVNLNFNADTSKAKAQIQDLYKTLESVSASSRSSTDIFNTASLKEGVNAAKELRNHLQSAVDANTGKLNLSAFSASLRQSGKSLQDYKRQLEALGPEGEAAFLKIRKSIATADAPLKKTNDKLREFSTTLKNTARWQISSSILHGFMGTLQSAYGYAQDLNRSLNDIRIVTGYSAEQMDVFAEKANRAAKALSTTTTAYTDAALIFYQQGLGDAEVEERTNVTIKMAHAAGESATEVSSYMTAIWNNFDDGSKSLEYYGDVMAKLGAQTAASSAEIAAGLEKFASIGETVGLSYEYATAAVATIVDKTRQSADTVGTALKTIFARLQGLELGETLEDGVNLNKYSSALQAVGVSVLDLNGNLRDADDIIYDLGMKWETLNNAQQTALAQTVAGTRQYTQLMALMENFDSFQANVTTAESSTGTLDEQAEIYAESWEAAEARVKAAAENIYDSLLNDDFFIDLTDAFATLLKGVGGFADGLGGMKGIIGMVSGFIAQKLAKEAPAALANIKQNLMQITGIAGKIADQTQKENIADLQKESKVSMTSFQEGEGSLAYAADIQMTEYIAEQKNKLIQYENQYSEAEKKAAEQEIQDLEQTSERLVKKGQEYDNLNKASQNAYDTIISKLKDVKNTDGSIKKTKTELIEMIDNIQDLGKRAGNLKTLDKAFENLPKAMGKTGKEADDIKNKLMTMAKSASSVSSGDTKQAFDDLITRLKNLGTAAQVGDDSLDLIATDLKQEVSSAASIAKTQLDGATSEFTELGAATGLTEPQLKAFVAILQRMGVISAEVPMQLQGVSSTLGAIGPHAASASEAMMSFSGALMQVSSFITSMKSVKDVFTDEDATAVEKIGAAISALTAVYMTFNAISKLTATLMALETAAKEKSAIATFLSAIAKGKEATAESIALPGKWANVTATIAQTLANWGLNASMAPLLIVTLALVAAILVLTVAITAIVALVNTASDAYNKDAIAAENAENAAKNLAETYGKVKQEYEDMIATMEQYQTARDALSELTKGTDEYNAALKEANRAAMELINTYPEFFGAGSYAWENGELIIDEGAMDAAKKAKEAEADQAFAASQMADVQAREARNKANLTDAKREIRDENGLGNGDKVWNGIAAAAIGAALGPVGSTIATGAIAIMEARSQEFDAAIEKAVEIGKDNQNLFDSPEAMAKALGISLNDSALIDALWENRDSIQQLSNDMNAAEAAWELAAQNSANEILNNNELVQKSANAEEIMDAGGSVYGVAYDKAYEDYLTKAKDRGLFNTGTDDSKKAFEDYAKAAGLDKLKNFEVTNYKGDGTVEYEYIDEDGEKQTKLATAEEIAATLAAADATGKLNEAAEHLAQTFDILDNSGQAFDQAMKNFIASGDLEGATKEEAEALVAEVDANGDGVTADESQSYLNAKFGGEDGILSDEEAALYGHESAQAMIDAFTAELNNIDEAWNSIELPDNLNGLEGMSLKTAQAFENSLKEMNLGPAGEVAGETYVEGINKMMEGVDAEDQQAALSQLSTIDWSSWDALEQADALMKEFGVDIDTSSEYWQNFANEMRTANGAIPDFTQLRDTLTEVTGILSDLDFGSVISDEDYAKLVAYNDEWERFFMLQADGSRVFIGDSKEMLQATRDDINAQREALRARQAAQEGFNNVGWGHEENGVRVSEDWANKKGSDTGTAQNLLNAGGATEDMLEILGYNDATLSSILDKATNGTTEEIEAAKAQLEEMYHRIAEFQGEDLAAVNAELNEMMASTATNVSDLNQMLQAGEIDAAAYDKQLTILANNASSLEELQEIQAAGLSADAGLSTLEYGEALMKLAENYDNCTDEMADYEAALLSGDEAQIKAAQSALELSIEIGEMAEKFGLDAEETENYAKRLAKNLGIDEKAASKLAVANQRLDRGMLSLNENLEEYNDSLKKNSKNSAEWSKTMDAVKTDMADLLNIADGAMLSDEFAEATLASEDFKKALDGDIDAINRLKTAAADDIIASIKANIEGEENMQAFQAQWDYLKANMEKTIKAGNVDQSQLIASFNDMIAKGNMTKDQIEAALAGLHVSANVKTTYVPQKVTVPQTITEEAMVDAGMETVMVPGPDGEWVPQDVMMKKKITRTYDAGTVEVDGVVPQYSIEGTEGEGGITTAFAPAPAITPSYSSTSTGVQESGGGGGGSTKKPEYNNEEYKQPKDEKERYRVIKNQIEDLTAIYENLSGAKDKAFGSAKLSALNREIAAHKKLAQANREYLSEIENYLSQDKIAASSVGARFDKNGTITNYDQIVEKAVADYNAAVDAFNKATTDDEGAKKAFEAAQERYDEIMEILDQYDETHDLWLEQMQKVLDDVMTEQEKMLERTQLEVELKINVSEDSLAYLEYMMDNIENKAYDVAEAFSYLNGMTGEYLNTAEALEGGLRGIFANKGLSDSDFANFMGGNTATFDKLVGMLSSGGFADLSDGLQQAEIDAAYGFTAEDVDTIRDYVSQLIEANENLQEVRQTVHEQILNVWEKWNEKLDDQISKIEHLQSITESYLNIIDIVGQKNLGVSNAFMAKAQQQTVDQANDRLVAEKARYDELKKARDDAYKKFEEQKAKGILSPEEIQMWEESLAQMDADVQSAAESFQTAWEDALTAANEAFEAAVDRIIQAYDDAAAGLMGSMTELQEAFDRKSDLSSQYLDDYEKIYQLSKLNRDLENSIDSTDNIKAKRELLELQSKINAYEEAGTEISEYQMEQLRQEYELKKAQIELEEAQDAKSQVQMTRDADGNYSYVYTANTEDVAEAEQNYEDKLHAMQESNANYINELQGNMIQMEQEYQEKVQEIMKDTSLTAEERMIKLDELNQYYDDKMKFYISEAQLWEVNSQRLYEQDWKNYAAATGYKISEEDKWLDHWDETQFAILTGFTTLEDWHSNHNTNVAILLNASSEAFATWTLNIETAMQNAGTSMGTFQEDAEEVLSTVAEESENTKDSVVDMANTAAEKIGEVVSAVVTWENQYSQTVQKMLTWNNALITSFNKLIAGWSAVQSSANSSGAGSTDGNNSGNNGNSGSTDSNSNSGSGRGNVDNSDKVAGVAAAIWIDGASASGWGNDPTRAKRLKEKGVEGAQAYINAHGPSGDIYADWSNKRGKLRQYYYGSFDTGGYTGEWGDTQGKFAMLHQKEIVLNEDDTTNFLKTVDIVRQIAEMIDLNALSSAGGFNSLFAATTSNLATTLQQEVTIHAEFPNATDKDEISAAFSDLVNLASQYANRK